MKCPRCQSDASSKNGFHKGKQKYICKSCGRQWLSHQGSRGYPQPVRDLCLKMHRNGLEAKVIGQYTDISYNTIINWIKQDQQGRSSSRPLTDPDARDADRYPSDFITSLQPAENSHCRHAEF